MTCHASAPVMAKVGWQRHIKIHPPQRGRPYVLIPLHPQQHSSTPFRCALDIMLQRHNFHRRWVHYSYINLKSLHRPRLTRSDWIDIKRARRWQAVTAPEGDQNRRDPSSDIISFVPARSESSARIHHRQWTSTIISETIIGFRIPQIHSHASFNRE